MANFNLNKIIIGGRLVSDPELKTTPSGISVSSFSVAVNRKADRNTTDFFNVTAWRGTAEFICKYFRKASSICIIGELHNRSWTDKEGNKRTSVEIVCEEASFVDGKNDNATPGEYDDSAYNSAAKPIVSAPAFEPIRDDEELPF